MNPKFSICIPHFGMLNGTDCLIAAIECLATQSFKDFEVCISDDASPDGRQDEIVSKLKELGLQYSFFIREENGRYDVNIRSAISLARGEYCVLMGNDDSLNGETALQRLADALGESQEFGVLIPDFQDYKTGALGGRIVKTRCFEGTPYTASQRFRNFAFVSGIVFNRQSAQILQSETWDGSEMYQMWIGCRMISMGHKLLELAEPIIRKDILIGGKSRAGSYAWRPKISPCPIITRTLPFNDIGRVVCDALGQTQLNKQSRALYFSVFFQLFAITYPYWVVEYRRVQSWKFGLGIVLGMRPKRSMRGVRFGTIRRALLEGIFVFSSLLALIIPLRAFSQIQPMLYRFVKSRP